MGYAFFLLQMYCLLASRQKSDLLQIKLYCDFVQERKNVVF